ncbi:hypothetical protein OPQ81_011963 [Rhizoctonia solani]|nr:hypothetical protein OPQ81_011963 [Rhizoctonia solani]
MEILTFDDVDIVSLPEKRSEAEERWVSFQPYLLSKGYTLRPRYQPDWTPSWRGTDISPLSCEDSADSMPVRVLDAIRIHDGQQVMIKMNVPSRTDSEGENEFALLQHFSTPPLRNNPYNHVVPCLDSFPIPNVSGGNFIVMPLLRRYKDIPFYNLAELHDLLRQLFNGLVFMHENNVAHGDIASPNVMMDARALYDEPFHPFFQAHSADIQRLIFPRYRRSQKQIRYFYIDLGYAKWFRDSKAPRVVIGKTAREIAPEQRDGSPYDPFIADIYQLGMMINRDLVQQIEDLGFLLPLVRDMTKTNPIDRPTLGEAQTRMNNAFLGLSGWRYRRPIIPPNTSFRERWRGMFAGLVDELKLWLGRFARLLWSR